LASTDSNKPRLAQSGDAIEIGRHFLVAFQRTLRVPEDGKVYPLPPGLGRLPVTVLDVPALGTQSSGFAIPLHQREAMWLAFGGSWWHPHAVQVSVGGINAIDGATWPAELSSNPQNYIVTPTQPWLDGINAGAGHVRQFVALPLDDPRTIEAQLSGSGKVGGLQLRVFPPKPGRFPECEPPRPPIKRAGVASMGLGAGGKIAQRIYTDPHGLETWDTSRPMTLWIQILNSIQFRFLTGVQAPPSVITSETYTKYHLPWFEPYDEDQKALAQSDLLASVVPTGGSSESEKTVSVPEKDVRKIRNQKDR
jgi:hypothetical protein